MLRSLALRSSPHGATAIGDALHLAQSILPAHGARVVVVLTDGVSNAGSDPVLAARDLAQQGIHLAMVGIAAHDDIEGERTLQRAAAAARGTYVAASNANAIHQALRRVDRRTRGAARRWRHVGVPFAAAGEGLLMLAFVLRGAWG